MKSNKSILVFGCGELQQSIIGRAHKKGLFVVGIDPCADAYCKDDTDAFEVVGGQDFEGTCSVVEKYGIEADRISTAAGGATCDILPEADLNRVCVSVAK